MIMCFPLERNGLRHKVIQSKYDLHLDGWDANVEVNVTHAGPWKRIFSFYKSGFFKIGRWLKY